MELDKEYLKDYFSNILKETWMFKTDFKNSIYNDKLPRLGKFQISDPVKKEDIAFDYEKIQTVAFDEIFNGEHYLIGKCPSYYFLAIRKDESEYPWVSIIKNDTLSPMIKEITFFKEMFPNVKKSDFASKLLLSNKLTDNLSVTPVKEKKKVNKI